MILCRPAVAGLYGAIFGVLMLAPWAGAASSSEKPPEELPPQPGAPPDGT
ncbi:MAG: hypothetical protein HY901_11800 [Deltaproteobacteria bacterium]|nr:hypothetical protein [Deltaproteobacteria bacterium]